MNAHIKNSEATAPVSNRHQKPSKAKVVLSVEKCRSEVEIEAVRKPAQMSMAT